VRLVTVDIESVSFVCVMLCTLFTMVSYFLSSSAYPNHSGGGVMPQARRGGGSSPPGTLISSPQLKRLLDTLFACRHRARHRCLPSLVVGFSNITPTIINLFISSPNTYHLHTTTAPNLHPRHLQRQKLPYHIHYPAYNYRQQPP
jgi:hypothetical protein